MKRDGAVLCESLALLRGQLLLEAVGHGGRGRPERLDNISSLGKNSSLLSSSEPSNHNLRKDSSSITLLGPHHPDLNFLMVSHRVDLVAG